MNDQISEEAIRELEATTGLTRPSMRGNPTGAPAKPYEPTDREVLMEMLGDPSEFFSKLGKAAYHADDENLGRIKQAFPVQWEMYRQRFVGRTQTPTEGQVRESLISEMVKKVPELTFGYIGNFERWGDDRKLFIWVKGLRWENGNQKDIWSATARCLSAEDHLAACNAVCGFKLGLEAGRLPVPAEKQVETHEDQCCSGMRIDVFDGTRPTAADLPSSYVRRAWIPQTLGDQMWSIIQFATVEQRQAWEDALRPELKGQLDRAVIQAMKRYGWGICDVNGFVINDGVFKP